MKKLKLEPILTQKRKQSVNTKMNIFKTIILVVILFHRAFSGDDKLKIGREALQKGDYQTAIIALRDAVKDDKKNPEPYVLLGTALLKADSTEAALGPLFQARDLDTNNSKIFLLLGDVYSKQKIYVAAAEQYKKVTEMDPKNIEAFLKLAEAYRKARQYTLAAGAYGSVLSLDSNAVPALRELSSIYFRAKQWANACPLLARLTKAQPDSLNYQIQYVKALWEVKRYNDVISVGEKVLQKDPSLIDIQTIVADATTALGKNAEIVQAFRKLNVDSLSVDRLIHFATALKLLDSLEESEKIFLKAYRKDSTRCDIPYVFGTLYMKLKKYPEAIKMFEKKIACDTSAGYQFASHLNLAMSLMQLKKFKEAKEHILKSIDLRPENVQAWTTLAQCCGQLDQTSEEISAYKKVIDLANAAVANGDEGKYNTQLGEAYRMIGVRYLIEATKIKDDQEKAKKQYGISLEYLRKAVVYNPKDCPLLLWTAQANQNCNNKDEAKKFYHKVIETCPKSKEADDARKGLIALGEK